MAFNTTFVDFVTPVPATWLNNVDQNVNWTPPYTGSQIRSISSKAGEVISVKDFGAVGNNIINDTLAFQAALNYLQSIGGGSLYIPTGTYQLTSQLTFVFPGTPHSLHIYGDGPDNTILNFPSTSGVSIQYNSPFNSMNLENFSMVTGTTNTMTGITITKNDSLYAIGPINTLRNIHFRSNAGYNTISGHFWQTAISITSVSNFNFDCCNFEGSCTVNGVASTGQGRGVTIQGTSALPPVIFNFVGCNFLYLALCINYGSYVQGMAILNTNFTVCIQGVAIATGLDNTLSQLSVSNSQFACSAFAIDMGTAVNPFNFSNNVVEIYPSSYGINGQIGICSITGNTFLGLATQVGNTGIGWQTQPTVPGGNASGIISGNIFYFLGLGIQIAAPVTGVNVQSNNYTAVTTPIANAGTGNTIGGGST